MSSETINDIFLFVALIIITLVIPFIIIWAAGSTSDNDEEKRR